jgi:hypothetical protein
MLLMRLESDMRLCFGLLLLMLSLLPTPAKAHGGGAPQLSDVAAGPYRLFVWTQPEPARPGEVHLTVAVTSPQQGATAKELETAVTDAHVEVQFAPIEQLAQAFWVTATQPSAATNFNYEADVELAQAGLWQVTVMVKGAEGDGSAYFELQVLPARGVSWPLIVGILAALAVVALFLWRPQLHQGEKRLLRDSGT